LLLKIAQEKRHNNIQITPLGLLLKTAQEKKRHKNIQITPLGLLLKTAQEKRHNNIAITAPDPENCRGKKAQQYFNYCSRP
jgi:hypothetical protein